MVEGVAAAAVGFVCVLSRIAAMIGLLPIFGESRLPRRIGVIFVLSLAMVVSVRNPDLLLLDDLLISDAVQLVLGNILLGGVAGITARLIVSAVSVAGTVAGGVGGLSFAGIIDPGGGQAPNAMGGFLVVLLGLVVLSSGALGVWVKILLQSFEVFPPAFVHVPTSGLEVMLNGMETCFAIAFVLAAPVVGAQLVGHLVLALATRAAPRANIFFAIGFIVPLFLGGLALFFVMPHQLGVIEQLVERATEAVAGILLGG